MYHIDVHWTQISEWKQFFFVVVVIVVVESIENVEYKLKIALGKDDGGKICRAIRITRRTI